MIDADIKKFIREEIRRQVMVILPGSSGENDQQSETISQMYPGMADQPARPVMHPYGFVSRAAQGTIQVVGRNGDHPANRMVLGHRDKNRPSDLSSGESAVYSFGKYQVRVKNELLEIGKDGDFEPMVMGETLRDFLIEFINLYLAHSHVTTAPGYLTTVPADAANVLATQQLKANNLDNDKILAKDDGRF